MSSPIFSCKLKRLAEQTQNGIVKVSPPFFDHGLNGLTQIKPKTENL